MPTHQLHNQCLSWRVYTHGVSTYKIQRIHFVSFSVPAAIPDSLPELFELAASSPQVCVKNTLSSSCSTVTPVLPDGASVLALCALGLAN